MTNEEPEINPLDRIWGASASEDGCFVVAVDPADMKSICRWGETPHKQA
jgi:hypothetical protein